MHKEAPTGPPFPFDLLSAVHYDCGRPQEQPHCPEGNQAMSDGMLHVGAAPCTIWLVVGLVALTAGAAQGADERKSTLRTLPPLEIDLGAPSCSILRPSVPNYEKAADALADALAKATGRRPAVHPDTADPDTLGAGPLLVLGNLTDCAAARTLTLTGYDLTDLAWPGVGGHVVRTIRDPFGTGAHVVVLGGSDAAGAAAAAARLAAIAAGDGPRLGYRNEVKLGANADAIEGWSSKLLGPDPDDKIWRKRGSYGSWHFMGEIGKAAAGYLRTADPAYLPVFKRELLAFFDHDVHHPSGEAHQMIHGLVRAFLLPWDLIRDHPFFTEADRRRIDEEILFISRSSEGPGPLAGMKGRWAVRGNHDTQRALDAFFLGRYFWRRYGLEEGKKWMGLAEACFAPQMTSWKPIEDNYGHEYGISLFNTLQYALAAGRTDYVRSEAFRRSAERAIIAYAVGTKVGGYLSACAVAARDPRYLSLELEAGGEAYVRACAAMKGHSGNSEYLRAFCGFPAPKPHGDLLGMGVAPVDPLWYKSNWINPGGIYKKVFPQEQCIDKISMRDGFRADDFYLLIDGIAGGNHAFEDANCLVRYHERGVLWFTLGRGLGGPTASTVRQQNGVALSLDGQGPRHLHRFARLLYATERPEGYFAIGCALEGLSPIAWHRHVLRRKGAWTLVIDRAVAESAGEMLVERHWHPRGKLTTTPDGLVSVAKRGGKKVCFHLQSAGLPPDAMTGSRDRKETVRAKAQPGHAIEIATLLHVNGDPAAPDYRVVQAAGGWRVEGKDGAVTVAARKDGIDVAPAATPAAPAAAPAALPLTPPAPPVPLPWRVAALGGTVTAVAPGPGLVAAGNEAGDIAVLDNQAAVRWRAKVGTRVVSLHFLGSDLLVGEDDGTISRFDSAGKPLWRVTIPYETIPWAHWSMTRCCIREITSADIDGDGQQEILLSNGDRRIYAFDGAGKQLWRAPVAWGIYIAMTPGKHNGQFALYGGATGPTIWGYCILYGATGDVLGHLDKPTIESQQMRDLWLADVNGDGADEIVCGLDSACRQLFVCDAGRKVLWEADVGGGAETIAVRSRKGRQQVLCGTVGGYLLAFDGARGARDWLCYLGECPLCLWPQRDGSVLAPCPSGAVLVVNGRGELTGRHSLGARITAAPRPGEHRAKADQLVLGTADGRVLVLSGTRGR